MYLMYIFNPMLYLSSDKYIIVNNYYDLPTFLFIIQVNMFNTY